MSLHRQLRFWLAALVVALIAVYLLRDILMPFVAGMAIAYFFDPVCDWLERRGLSRTWATAAVTVVFLLLFLLLLALLVPMLASQLADLAARLPDLVEMLRSRLADLVAGLGDRFDPAVMERVRTAIGDATSEVAGIAASGAGKVVTSGLAIANLLSLVFLTPVVAFFLLRDWDRMVAGIDGWLPRAHADTIRDLARQIDEILSGFVRGVGIVCLVLGTFYAVALTIVGLEFGLIVGAFAGLLSFIPYVGAIAGLLLSVGLALVQFDSLTDVALVAGIFLVGQAIEGNFLTPKLVGERIKLHPVIVIFALLAGGTLFGFTGILLAVPAAAAIGVVARFAIRQYLDSPLYDDGQAQEEERGGDGEGI
ncbi:MAG: AI-2E family transporter [Sneathiellaceae bacterium]